MKRRAYGVLLLSLLMTASGVGVSPKGFANPQPAASQAAPQTPQGKMLARLFTSSVVLANWFAPSFLAQVAAPQVQTIINNMKQQLGPYQGIREEGTGFGVVFEKGIVPTRLVLNQQGLISGLLFQAPRSHPQPSQDLASAFQALPGKVSVLVLENGTPKLAYNSDQPLAVGSAFKLAVLNVLKTQIAAKQQSWETVLKLQSNLKSLPSGFLHTWPQNSALTVDSLAALMISQSDNTATDHLIQLVGKPALEQLSPRNTPFLMTRETFMLKNPQNVSLRDRFLATTVNQRQALLGESAPLPAVSDFESGVLSPEIEWFFTTTELCQLMANVADLPITQINPGVARPQDWRTISYKGGSEPGVLNFTTQLQGKNGKTFCVSATWNNNQPLEEAQFTALYSGLIDSLKSQAKPATTTD
ncbi:serine hydrolase [Acaryochloris sp. IP29b_bin.137]|uniref:serine hydrolase n=1 Tax=Acaryochloris sp. IP29b_bin.137 TaxID=2969217 RepID=UPI0026192235|nr:serine hydrolase [Acaryochloris sp. IP29b_bin.137]